MKGVVYIDTTRARARARGARSALLATGLARGRRNNEEHDDHDDQDGYDDVQLAGLSPSTAALESVALLPQHPTSNRVQMDVRASSWRSRSARPPLAAPGLRGHRPCAADRKLPVRTLRLPPRHPDKKQGLTSPMSPIMAFCSTTSPLMACAWPFRPRTPL